tara:strand:+ start:15754 stop:16248 length:495 start_codon:yes stop_codon:yes gene_type:complete
MANSENIKNSSEEELKLSRRNLFAIAGWGGILTSLGASVGASLRFMFPNVLYEPSPIVKLGKTSDYAEGSITFNESERMFIFRDSTGFKVISAVCTHLRCTVNWSDNNNRFECPCHGSVFNVEGKVISGPAPKPLKWLHVKASPDKRLVVNKNKVVDKDYSLIV